MIIFIRRLNYLFLISIFFLILGMINFKNSIPESPSSINPSDAIIVLTGDRGKRIEKGYELIEKSKRYKMFITGVGGSKQVLQEILGFDKSKVECCIEFGYNAKNTYQNAIETKIWASKNNIHSITLVTTDLHMQRSLFLFTQITNLEIQIYPIAYRNKVIPLEKLFFEYIKYIVSRVVFIKKYED